MYYCFESKEANERQTKLSIKYGNKRILNILLMSSVNIKIF
jgi:hypothetical protein